MAKQGARVRIWRAQRGQQKGEALFAPPLPVQFDQGQSPATPIALAGRFDAGLGEQKSKVPSMLFHERRALLI